MRLCLAAGRLDFRNVLQELTADDMAWWQAYARLEPFGPLRDDLRAGTLASLIANQHRKEPLQPHDFFPTLPDPRPKMTGGQLAQALNRLVKRGGARRG